MSYHFIHSRRLLLEHVPGSDWASEMVLNPAIIQDPSSGRIHMLFRATGPWVEKRQPGKPMPYPIFLGYGWSDDEGATWEFDLETPAFAPNMEYDIDKIYINDDKGNRVVNHANGCIEDPRLLFFDGECYMSTACRMFPPGPYWEKDEPTQCAPEWIKTQENPFGRAASENVTVNVLFRVDLKKLSCREYHNAFHYITPLTNAEFGEDRDVFFFPERLVINGEKKIVMLQRPFNPSAYPFFKETKPSIVITTGDRFEDFVKPDRVRQILAVPAFEWEKNRIGASVPPIKMGQGEWLLNYHGKQDEVEGYTQSFMILKEQEQGLPEVIHRCHERLIKAEEQWEQPGKFKTPCVFITGLIRMGDTLLASYGAADEKVGIMEIEVRELVEFLKKH